MSQKIDKTTFEPLPRCQAFDRQLDQQCGGKASGSYLLCRSCRGGPPAGNTNAAKSGLYAERFVRETSMLRKVFADPDHDLWDSTATDPKFNCEELIRTNKILMRDTIQEMQIAKARNSMDRFMKLSEQYVYLVEAQQKLIKTLAQIQGNIQDGPTGIVLMPMKEVEAASRNEQLRRRDERVPDLIGSADEEGEAP